MVGAPCCCLRRRIAGIRTPNTPWRSGMSRRHAGRVTSQGGAPPCDALPRGIGMAETDRSRDHRAQPRSFLGARPSRPGRNLAGVPGKLQYCAGTRGPCQFELQVGASGDSRAMAPWCHVTQAGEEAGASQASGQSRGLFLLLGHHRVRAPLQISQRRCGPGSTGPEPDRRRRG